MDIVKQILSNRFPGEQWEIEKPSGGLSKESYIAVSSDKKVFIKFDAYTPALKRLAEIGVTPSILVTDKFEGRPYFIQEYMEGQYPDKEWFSENITTLANFVLKYQTDELLRNLIANDSDDSYQQHIEKEINTVETTLKRANSEVFKDMPFTDSFAVLKEQAKKLKPSSLVPIHADPNIKNMLLTDRYPLK